MGASTERRRLYGEVDPRWRRRLSAVAEAAGYVVMAGAVLALMGRLFEVPVLAQWVPTRVVRPMQPMTAVLFVMGSVGLLGLLVRPGPVVRRVGYLAAGLLMAGAVAIVVANLADMRFPRWLLTSTTVEDILGGEVAARPALNEGVVLLAAGGALLLLTSRSVAAHVVGQLMAIAAAMVGAMVVVAFAYGDDGLRGFPLGTGRMSISTALLTIVLGGAIVVARPSLGIMAPTISPWPGGIVLRRLLPFALIAPPAAVALVLGASTPADQPRWFAVAAVLGSGVLMGGLFATAAAVSAATRRLAEAEDLADRATLAVTREASIVDSLLASLASRESGFDSLEVAVRFRPAEGWLAGDAVSTFRLDSDRLAAVVTDVVGHGAEPAVAALRLSDALQHSLRQGLGPAQAIADARWVLEGTDLMATVAVAEVDSRSGSVTYANAGGPPVLHRGREEVWRYGSTGPVLLGDGSGEWGEGKAVLDDGEALLLYSDGLADPTNPEGVALATVEDLCQVLERCPHLDAQRVADWCVEESLGRAEGIPRDDATLVVVARAIGNGTPAYPVRPAVS